MPYHIEAARNAILLYIHETGKADFRRKNDFSARKSCSGKKHGIKFGRLSGIVAHFIPKYLQKNRMPSWETNCIEDWETKIDAIVEETMIISGIPSWLQMYFERLQQKVVKNRGRKYLQTLISLFMEVKSLIEPSLKI
jgi:hypothetical protein